MTSNKRAKREARSRMEQTGESYSAARRATLNPDTMSFSKGLAFIDNLCANCMGPLPDEEDGLFCSKWCAETASSVRYFRRAHRDCRIQDPDVRDAVRTRLAFLAVGGYGALGRNLSPQTREAVKERANGLCQKCGQPGVDIDHIAGSSPELDNLQLLCKACHNAKTAENFVPAPIEIRTLIAELTVDRVMPEKPRLLADDDAAWPTTWRGLKTARRQRVLDELQELGIDPRGLKSRAEMVAAIEDAYDEDGDKWDEVDDEGSFGFDPQAAGDYDGGYGPNSYFHRAMNRDD